MVLGLRLLLSAFGGVASWLLALEFLGFRRRVFYAFGILFFLGSWLFGVFVAAASFVDSGSKAGRKEEWKEHPSLEHMF